MERWRAARVVGCALLASCVLGRRAPLHRAKKAFPRHRCCTVFLRPAHPRPAAFRQAGVGGRTLRGGRRDVSTHEGRSDALCQRVHVDECGWDVGLPAPVGESGCSPPWIYPWLYPWGVSVGCIRETYPWDLSGRCKLQNQSDGRGEGASGSTYAWRCNNAAWKKRPSRGSRRRRRGEDGDADDTLPPSLLLFRRPSSRNLINIA